VGILRSAGLLVLLAAFALGAVSQAGGIRELGWAFPGLGPRAQRRSSDMVESLPGSAAHYRWAQINSFYHVADWYPDAHPPMPAVVRIGSRPRVAACAYCHLANGAGRPENVALAGLPAWYITAQLRNMRAGLRTDADPTWLPSKIMVEESNALAERDIADAVAYFSGLHFVSHVRVIEAAEVPAFHDADFAYQRLPGDRREPLGDRIVEMPDSARGFALRDDRLTYTAYVPVGSIERGRSLALGGAGVVACAFCHGAGLRGTLTAPPIAGRFPGYLFRQLLAFRAGTRHASQDAQMHAETAHLSNDQMIALAAYVASLGTKR